MSETPLAESARYIAFEVSGRVQGVAFRAFVRDLAQTLALSGFVRNREDGAVEGEACGRPAAVDSFVAGLYSGSRFSRVDSVSVRELSSESSAVDFTIER